MDPMDAILTRRSIRKFTERQVTDEEIESILKAAMYAPSAGNRQPWHFIVVKDKKILKKIPVYHPYAKMAADASIAIIVCGDVNLELVDGYWIQDCSAASQNLLLAVHALGLGAVWCGVYPRPERVEAMAELFNLPENILPLALIPIGYPAEQKDTPERFNESRIHIDRW